MIAIVLIIVVVCVGIGILSFYGSGSLNNNNNNNNSTNEEEYPESSEYIGKEKAIEIFNNRDPSNTIELSVTAGSVLPEREDIINFKATEAKLIKNEDGIIVYKLTLKSKSSEGKGNYYAFVDAKTGKILGRTYVNTNFSLTMIKM